MTPLELATLTVNGAALDLGDVLADVTIRHGRTGFFDAASASTCQITLLGVDRALTAPFRLGALLVVNATDGSTVAPRFTGRFTDATLVDDVLTAIAVGALRTLPGYELVAAYPQEKWSARVTRAFAEAAIAGTLALELGPFDPLLVAEPAPSSTRTLGGYLDELAAMVGAAVADLPDGRILVQAIDSRTIGGAVALDPAEVGYAPEWALRLPGANIVDVTYGEPASSVSARDPASVALYGPIAASVATRFLNAVDAQAVANGRIASGAYSRWTVGDAPLLVGLALKIGTPGNALAPAARGASCLMDAAPRGLDRSSRVGRRTARMDDGARPLRPAPIRARPALERRTDDGRVSVEYDQPIDRLARRALARRARPGITEELAVTDVIESLAAATTPGGIPYPASTDPVSQGAAAMQAIAVAVDGLYRIAEYDLAALQGSPWSIDGILRNTKR